MKTTTWTRSSGGFTLVEIMIVVSIVALLASIALPGLIRARAKTQSATCINNLRQIESACQQVAIANNLGPGATIQWPAEVAPYIKLKADGSIPGCPAKGDYSLLLVGENPQSQCSLGDTVSPAHILQ
jgi:prepilin-type N-terminal cleavage/methylation domain-containing protein